MPDDPDAPAAFRQALEDLNWPIRRCAAILRCDDRMVRRWCSGVIAVPPSVLNWMLGLIDQIANPPQDWRRRPRGDAQLEHAKSGDAHE